MNEKEKIFKRFVDLVIVNMILTRNYGKKKELDLELETN